MQCCCVTICIQRCSGAQRSHHHSWCVFAARQNPGAHFSSWNDCSGGTLHFCFHISINYLLSLQNLRSFFAFSHQKSYDSTLLFHWLHFVIKWNPLHREPVSERKIDIGPFLLTETKWAFLWWQIMFVCMFDVNFCVSSCNQTHSRVPWEKSFWKKKARSTFLVLS